MVPAAVNLLDPATAAKLAAKQQAPQQGQQRSKQGPQQLDEAVAAAPALHALLAGGLDPVVLRCMVKLGFTEPTPIQAACWRPACVGHDLLGHAEPGMCPACDVLLSSTTLCTVCRAFSPCSSHYLYARLRQQQQGQQ